MTTVESKNMYFCQRCGVPNVIVLQCQQCGMYIHEQAQLTSTITALKQRVEVLERDNEILKRDNNHMKTCMIYDKVLSAVQDLNGKYELEKQTTGNIKTLFKRMRNMRNNTFHYLLDDMNDVELYSYLHVLLNNLEKHKDVLGYGRINIEILFPTIVEFLHFKLDESTVQLNDDYVYDAERWWKY